MFNFETKIKNENEAISQYYASRQQWPCIRQPDLKIKNSSFDNQWGKCVESKLAIKPEVLIKHDCKFEFNSGSLYLEKMERGWDST